MVDTGDLKSPGYCSCAGSSPASGTTCFKYYRIKTRRQGWRHSQVAKAGACKALIPGSNPGVASKFYCLSGDGRAVECTGLENQRGSHLREFESPSPGHHFLSKSKVDKLLFNPASMVSKLLLLLILKLPLWGSIKSKFSTIPATL